MGRELLFTQGERVASVPRVEAVDLLRFDELADQAVVVARNRPERLRPLASVRLDRDAVGVGDAREKEPGVPARRAGGDGVPLDERDLAPAPGQKVRSRDAGDPAAEDRDVGRRVSLERGARRVWLVEPERNRHAPHYSGASARFL